MILAGLIASKRTGRAAAVVCSLALVLVLSASASAKTFTPTRHDDPNPNKCRPNNCSLREAIGAANNHSGPDKVLLAKGTYNLQIPFSGGVLNGQGDLDVLDSTVIRGQGPSATRIDANALDRVFFFIVDSGSSSTLRSLTVTGGDSSVVPEHGDSGGGIASVGFGHLTLKDVVIRGNHGALGGGVESETSQLTIKNSTIAHNTAGEGAGVDLRAYFSEPVTSILSSTISDNTAGKGGGILADGYHVSPDLVEPVLHLLNSTVAGNTTSAEGGGIMADNGATVTLDNATVAYNMADDDNTGGGVGGGVHQHSGADFVLIDSIVASNTVGTSGTDAACSGTFFGGGNVVTAGAGCDSLMAGFNQFVGDSDLIGPLAENGGPTKTIALLSGHAAIGYATTCPKHDQRGVARPPSGCDSGSFERKGP